MLQSIDIHSLDIHCMDNTSMTRIKQAESSGLAVRRIRARLGLTQAEFASRIGCNQNTVSRYEACKVLPSTESFLALWNVADASEQKLLTTHLHEMFSLLDKEDKANFLQVAEEAANRAGVAPPSVLARMTRVCTKYKGEPDAAQLIDRAASWLETEFEMRSLQRASAEGKNPSEAPKPEAMGRILPPDKQAGKD
jgi:transcriptional regulator with XRE-family HTH domain